MTLNRFDLSPIEVLSQNWALVVDRFIIHVNQHHLLPVHQSVYRPDHSTETAIATVHKGIARAVDNGDVSALILLDLSSAFDTVDHVVLLEVLEERFGVKNVELEWARSYLSDRTRCFCVASQTSTPVQLTCSVPQGSVIDPVIGRRCVHGRRGY